MLRSDKYAHSQIKSEGSQSIDCDTAYVTKWASGNYLNCITNIDDFSM